MFSRKIYLKGTNKLKAPIWKGLDITLSYIGSFDNNHFGIGKSKLTMNEAMKQNQMKSFIRRFHNLKLKNISHMNNSKGTFEEINLTCNNGSFMNAGKVIQFKSKYENNIIDILNDVYLNKLHKKQRNSSNICMLKKNVCVQTDHSSLESKVENESCLKKIIEGYSYKREKFPLIKDVRCYVEKERSRNCKKEVKNRNKMINCKSMMDVNRRLSMNNGLTMFLQRNKY